MRPESALLLDPSGLHLRARRPEDRFHLAWPDLADVRVQGAGDAALVALTALDPAVPDAQGRPTVRTVVLPRFHGWRADDVAAEIERLRRAYRPAPAPLRREEWT